MGKLYVVGIGPGNKQDLSLRALKALESAELICGYTVYTELLKPIFPAKRYYSTGMTGEMERCRFCLEQAAAGVSVALVCSGDAGVYGMAGPVLELKPEYPRVELELIPGITAALSGAALLGAPLGHDFCVISLSDRLTSWEAIEKRLRAAAEGDFAICLYNPVSRHRPDHLKRAVDVLLQKLAPETVCGMAKKIGREGESMELLSLQQLREADTDMFTTVFIGNSQTMERDGRMITPRGYRQ